LQRRTARAWYWAAWAALVALANYLYFGWYGIELLVRPDSLGYLEITPDRTAGYPLFLKLLGPLYPNWVAPVQLNLYFLAVASFGAVLVERAPWRWVGFVAMVMLVMHSGLQMLAMWQLSDALFATALVAFLGACFGLVTRPTVPAAVLVSVLCGSAMLVRPVGYFLFASMLFVSIAGAGLTRAMRAALWLPALSLLLTASVANLVRYDVFSPQVMGGYALLGHVVERVSDATGTEHPALAAKIAKAVEPVIAQRAPAEYPLEYQAVTTSDYNELLWQTALPLVRSYVADHYPSEHIRVATSRVASELAWAAIAHDPWWYGRHVWAHAIGLVWPVLKYPPALGFELDSAVASSNRLLDRNPELIAAGIRSTPTETEPLPQVLVAALWLINFAWIVLSTYGPLILVALAVTTLVAVIATLRTASPVQSYLAILGISLFGYTALVASVQVALPRYTLPAVPIALVFTLLLGAGTASWVRARIGALRRS
jgi:hypothetical protein